MQNFLFRLKDGSFIHYFFETPNKIRFKKFNNECFPDNFGIIVNDATQSFAIDIDKSDNSHIIYQNKRGGISYSSFDGKNIKNTEMLISRQNDIYERYFKTLASADYVHFFYILKKDNQYHLIFHNINIVKGEFSTPKIIGNVVENSLCYDISSDLHQNIHVFFPSAGNSSDYNINIEYKIFIRDSTIWKDSRFFKVSSDNVTHISSTIANGLAPIFASRQTFSNTAQATRIIIKNTASFSKSEIQITDTNIKYCKNLELITANNSPLLILQDERYSNIYGIDFNNPVSKPMQKFIINSSKHCRYRSNFPFEEIIIDNLPVFFGKKLSLSFLDKINLGSSYKIAMQKEIQNLSDKIFTLEKLIFEKHQAIDKLNLRIRYLEMQKNKPL